MTSVSKNVYIDKLDDIVNIIIHTIAQLKRNLLMYNQTHILSLVRKLIIKILQLLLVLSKLSDILNNDVVKEDMYDAKIRN